MIPDIQNAYSVAQAITATAASSQTLRKKGGSLGWGAGKQLYLVVQVIESFNTLTNLKFDWETHTADSWSSPTTLDTRTITLASGNLAAGKGYTVPVPQSGLLEYSRMNYTVTGTDPTAGKINAFIVAEIDLFNVVSFA